MRIRARTIVRLLSEGNCEPIECICPESGLVFLVSSRMRIGLSAELHEDDLPHAIFVFKGRNISAAALRRDVSIGGKRIARPRCGTTVCVGRFAFKFESNKQRAFDWNFARVKKPAVCTAAAILFSISLALAALFVARNPIDSPESSYVEASQIRPSATDEAALIEEAKQHLREGRAEQARLALVQAQENDPSGEASRMIAAMDADGEVQSDKGKLLAGQQEKARALFDRGREELLAGDAAGAYRDLFGAQEALKDAGASAPFADELRAALRYAEDAAMNIAAKQAQEARDIIAAAREKNAGAAATLLVHAVEAAIAAEQVLPGNADAAETAVLARGALSAAAGRWMASARAAEQLSGCKKARPIYESISLALQGSNDPHLNEARERAAACMGTEETER